jgi:zinc transport system substrate-binding protein
MFMRLAVLLWCLAGPALAGPVVVTDIAPVQSLAAEVMGSAGSPELLIEGDPHEVTLRPSQARALAKADLVFWIGETLTPGLAGPVGSAPGVKIAFDETEGMGLRRTGGAIDPHLWLNPDNAHRMIDMMASALERADPANAAAYSANAEAARARLAEATGAAAKRLKPFRGARLIVSHDAVEYFVARFGLSVAGALTEGGSETASAARIAALHRTIEEGGADCVLGQPGPAEHAAERLAADTGLPYARIDPEAIEIPAGPDLYPRLIEGLAGAMATCLGPRNY